jgi:hypothetical protein
VMNSVGNLLGEASTYYDMAQEQAKSKARKKGSKRTEGQALKYFRRAARQTGRAYEQRATPSSITNWEADIDTAPAVDQRVWGAEPDWEIKEAEGAKLRKWET